MATSSFSHRVESHEQIFDEESVLDKDATKSLSVDALIDKRDKIEGKTEDLYTYLIIVISM